MSNRDVGVEKGDVQTQTGASANLPHLPSPEWEAVETNTITCRSIIINGVNVGIVLKNVLTPSECSHFVQVADNSSLTDVSSSKKYRNCHRLLTCGKDVAEVVYERILPFVGATFEVNEDTTTVHHDAFEVTHGQWKPTSLNPGWRLCKYTAGGHFSPHFDGEYTISSREKSLQTVMLYLNGGFKGGSTNFLKDNQPLHEDEEGRFCSNKENILECVRPEAGLCLIFHHRVMHEGEALQSDDCSKYMMRTELIYKNVQPCGRYTMTVSDEAALQLIKEAEHLESNGDAIAAMNSWRKAFKLSPVLEAHFNRTL